MLTGVALASGEWLGALFLLGVGLLVSASILKALGEILERLAVLEQMIKQQLARREEQVGRAAPEAGPQPEGLPDISRGSKPGGDPR
jgi:hypothetical protein